MKRRRFLGKSIAGGIGFGTASAMTPSASPAPPQQGAARSSPLPPNVAPSAYSNRSSGYNPFATPDYYTFADDLAIERNQPGEPHQGKVLAAVQAHSDDIPLFAGGLVAKDTGELGHGMRPCHEPAIDVHMAARERERIQVVRLHDVEVPVAAHRIRGRVHQPATERVHVPEQRTVRAQGELRLDLLRIGIAKGILVRTRHAAGQRSDRHGEHHQRAHVSRCRSRRPARDTVP